MKKKKKINVKLIAKNLIKRRIEEFFRKKKKLSFSPLGEIFPVERYTHSKMTGLMTSFGEKFWESLALDLAKKNNFIVRDKKEFHNNIPILEEEINSIVNQFQNSRLEKKSSLSELVTELKKKLVKNKNTEKVKKIPKGEGVDIWLEKENIEYMYDIKTVQVNAGTGPKISRNMCNWIAYRLEQKNDVNLITACVFPYDPHDGSFWEKEGGKIAPMKRGEDALLAGEFWDFISGQKNTMKNIIDAFKELKNDKSMNKLKSKFKAKD